MTATIQSQNQQSMYDLCKQAYGTEDLIVKFCNDNGIDDLNYIPPSPQFFVYDTGLVVTAITNNYVLASAGSPEEIIAYATEDKGFAYCSEDESSIYTTE